MSSLSLTPLSIIASCSPNKSNEDNTKQDSKDSLKFKKDQLIINSAEIKNLSYRDQIQNNIHKANLMVELIEIENRIQVAIEKERIESLLNGAGYDDNDKLIFLTKIRLAKSIDKVIEIELEIINNIKTFLSDQLKNSVFNDLTIESKEIVNKLVNDSRSRLDDKLILEKVKELYNSENSSKVLELFEELKIKINKIENNEQKTRFSELNKNNSKFLELKELEKQVDHVLNEERSQRILEAQKVFRPKLLLAQGLLKTLPESEEKNNTQKQIEDTDTEQKLDLIISDLNSKLTNPSSEQVNLFKEFVLIQVQTLETKSQKVFDDKVKEENVTFEKLKTILNEISEKYSEELNQKKSDSSLTNWLNNIQRNDPKFTEEFTQKIQNALTKEDLSNIRKQVLDKFRQYKPLQPTNLSTFKSNSPYQSTRVPETGEIPSGKDVIYTIRLSKGKEVPSNVYWNIPQLIRTFTPSSEDLIIKDKIIELRNNVIKTFFDDASKQNKSLTGYIYNSKVNSSSRSSMGLKLEISKLLWTIDKVLIEGYYYQEIYDWLIGVEQKEERQQPVSNHTYYSLKSLVDRLVKNPQTI